MERYTRRLLSSLIYRPYASEKSSVQPDYFDDREREQQQHPQGYSIYSIEIDTP